MKKETYYIEQLTKELKLYQERYDKLWNQHKLLRLAYRSLRLSVRKKTPERENSELNRAFVNLLYGPNREEASLMFNSQLETVNATPSTVKI